jgi:hypothetical protein
MPTCPMMEGTMTDDNGPPLLGAEIFSWPAYRSAATGPHEVRKSPDGKAVIIQRRGRDGDWPINLNALNGAVAAVSDGRLKVAYVAQVEWQKVLGWADVNTVAANVAGVPPRDGPWGAYHWLNADFKPVRFNGGVNDTAPW